MNYRMYVLDQDGGFTMNLISLEGRYPAEDDPCFVRAAVAVELTNTFMPRV